MVDTHTGRWFVTLLTRPSAATKADATKFTKMIGKGAYVVLHAFSDDDSNLLSASIRAKPQTVVLTDTGNVQIKEGPEIRLTHINLIDANSVKDLIVDSVQTLTLDPHYVFDTHNIISRNLRYILRREGLKWYLLYNPIHTRAFRDYYTSVMSRATDTVEWGMTTMRTDAHEDLQAAIHNYCDAFQVTNRDGSRSYLDPSCNITYSQTQCAQSAVMEDSRVKHDPKLLIANANVIDQMTSGSPPLCACVGDSHAYVRNHAPRDSFIFKFLGLEGCNPTMNNVICNVINNAGGDINVTNSTLRNDCGIGPPPIDDDVRSDPPEAPSINDDVVLDPKPRPIAVDNKPIDDGVLAMLLDPPSVDTPTYPSLFKLAAAVAVVGLAGIYYRRQRTRTP